jgi:ribosome recycling factor
MSADDILLDAEERMEKAVLVFSDALRGIRTGRASTGLVDSIRVPYYGSQTPLKQLAGVSTPDATLIVIRPYDPAILRDIERTIQQSELGLNPQNDGKVIRLVVPPLSEERRKQLVAQVRDMAEDARVAIRNVRRDANRSLDKAEKASEISEDQCRDAKDDVQKLTHEYETRVNDLLEKKSEELMQV